jgi:hypothetical protein
MLKRLIYALVLLFAFVIPIPQPIAGAPQPAPVEQKKDCAVFVTRTGHRYHKPGCSYLRQSRIPMTRSEAIKRGFAPCKRCGGSDCES